MTRNPTTGKAYWAVQIGVSAFFAIGGIGAAVLFYATETEDLGRGGVFVIIGVLFLGLLIWLLREYGKHSKQQRAVYAWAIMQQWSPAPYPQTGRDLKAMGIAARARDGKLSVAELNALQSLQPDNPYPGPPQSSTRMPSA